MGVIGFRIIDDHGQAWYLQELDREVAAFWGKEVKPKHWASPYKAKNSSSDETIREMMSMSWYDMIGQAIMNQGYYTTLNTWNNVIHTMMAASIGEEVLEASEYGADCNSDSIMKSTIATLEFYKPYVNLIKEFDKRGYKPERVMGE